MIFLYFLFGYIAIYWVIWLHEVGHGVMYAKYKCKDNPFHVHVPFYLFFSTPMPVDVEKASRLNVKQLYHVGIAGIIVNLLFGVPIASLLLVIDFDHTLFFFFLYAFALFHLVEAASYLVIANIFLSGDMVMVNQYNPKLRIPFLLVGLMIIGIIVYMLVNSPPNWQLGLVIAVVTMTACMAIGRIVFTIMNRAKSKNA